MTSTAADQTPSTSGAETRTFTAEQGEAYLRSLLDQQVRVTVTDGRSFVGNLSCIDQQGNVIINNGCEHRKAAPNKK